MVKPGDTIVHSGPLYAATETLIARVLGKFGVHFLDFPAGASRAEIDAVLAKANSGRVALLYLESPANPTNALVDVEAVRASRDAIWGNSEEKPPIAIDNRSAERSGGTEGVSTSRTRWSPQYQKKKKTRKSI